MPVLFNPQHERFCVEVHRRECEGMSQKSARDEAYAAAGYDSRQKHLSDNARKLARKPRIRARLDEMRTRTALLAELDAGWGMMHLKSYVEGKLHDDPPLYPAEKVSDRIAALNLMARIGGWEKPQKIAPTDPSGDNPAAPLMVVEIVKFSDAAKDQASRQQLAPAR